MIVCELSCLHRADGSALWRSGSTHVLAAVYGPIAPQIVNQEGSEGVVTVVIKSGNGDNLTLDYEMGNLITKVLSAAIDLSTFPRCVIEVVLQVIQSDGSLLSCMVHAAVAALLDAGVDLLFLPVATTCLVKGGHSLGVGEGGNEVLSVRLDPTALEEEEEIDSSIVVLVNDHTRGDHVFASHTLGPGVSLDEMLACLQVASKACQAIPAFWRLAMEQKVTRESQTLWSR